MRIHELSRDILVRENLVRCRAGAMSSQMAAKDKTPVGCTVLRSFFRAQIVLVQPPSSILLRPFLTNSIHYLCVALEYSIVKGCDLHSKMCRSYSGLMS